MPNLKASIKDVRQVKARRARNTTRSNAMKKLIKAYITQAKTDKAAAATQLPAVYKAIDKNTKRHILHRNTAARKKSKLAKLVAAK